MNISRTSRTSALLVGVIALLLACLTVPAQAAAGTGAVKGVVTVDGKPLKGARVELYWVGADSFSGPRLGVDTTNSKGAYSFSTFPVKDKNDSDLSGKAVIVKDPAGRIVATSRKFRDRAGRTVTRNVSAKRAGSITGVVKRGDGLTTARLRTQVFGPDVQIDPDYDSAFVYDTDVKVAKNGTFRLTGLPAGGYYLQFDDDGRTYFSQCYDNLPVATTECNGTFNTTGKPNGTKITVKTGQNVVLNPQTMSTKGSRISGTVTDTSGRAIVGTRVRAAKTGQRRLSTGTSTSGAFRFGPATDGTYQLQVVAKSPWAGPAVAPTFTVKGGDVAGITVRLKSRARLTAKLTAGKGTVTTRVDVTRAATGSRPSGTATISWGSASKTVRVVKGKAAAKLSRLPKGTRTITVTYSGTRSTASATATFRAKVG